MFPIYQSQKDKSIKGNVHSISLAMFFVQFVYIGLAFTGIFMYGSNIKDSLLINIGDFKNLLTDKSYWEVYMMQILFILILICHIPYIFYSGKESLLIIIDEIMRKSISKNMMN